MTLEEFKNKCIDEQTRKQKILERWERLYEKQKTLCKSYVPKKLLKNWYRLSCPYCGKKLIKLCIYHKEGYDYYEHKCKCGYEYITRKRTMFY